MSDLIFRVPTLYADHHVLRVRSALAALPGVQAIQASAARKQVTVTYDEAALSPEQIRQALVAAGYPPEQEPVFPELAPRHADGASWFILTHRTTETQMRDLEMSGDFRRY